MKLARQRKPVYTPGYDGTIESEADVRISPTRTDKRSMRCRTGSFEWRYARGKEKGLTALYHAGIEYASLWERAGAASASSPDLLAEGGGSWKGLPDGRVMALDKLKPLLIKLGHLSTHRLTAYCVEGQTVTEIADRFEAAPRDMAAVLHHDLKACAVHLHYL